MPYDEKQIFAEALAHWAEVVDAIRAQERAEAVARIEEEMNAELMRAFHSSSMGKHYAWKCRTQG